MKFVISPIEKALLSSVDVTLRVFRKIVDTIAPRILRPMMDISQVKCTLNNADIIVVERRLAAYMYLKDTRFNARVCTLFRVSVVFMAIKYLLLYCSQKSWQAHLVSVVSYDQTLFILRYLCPVI